jgi:ATP-dependent Clp protease adaptor protein ClpS
LFFDGGGDAIVGAMSERPQVPPVRDDGPDVVVERRTARKLKKPKLYKVLLHNDDYTTMEFVVYVLQAIFHRAPDDAVRIMLHVHQNGIGVAGVYTHEIAESRIAEVETLARQHEFPLRCSMEEA